MIKITITIDESQDQRVKDIQVQYAKKYIIKNYSKVVREVLDKGLKNFNANL